MTYMASAISVARVYFEAYSDGHLIVLERNTVGPLEEEDALFLYEIDGSDLLYTQGGVMKFESKTGIASVRLLEPPMLVEDYLSADDLPDEVRAIVENAERTLTPA